MYVACVVTLRHELLFPRLLVPAELLATFSSGPAAAGTYRSVSLSATDEEAGLVCTILNSGYRSILL
jgi:hypothetical protein